MIADALLGGAAALLLVGAWADLARRIIPDGISGGVLLTGIGLRLADGAAATVWLWAAGAALLTFTVLALVWRWGLIGGGDVKLLAASVLLVPPPSVPALLLWTSLAGGVLALAYLAAGALARRRVTRPAARPRTALRRVLRIEAWRLRRHSGLPYGCAIAAGTLIAFFCN